MIDYADFECPYLGRAQIHQKADLLLMEYWPKAGVPVDIELLVEKRGLNIIYDSDLKDIDAYLTIDMQNIVVNFQRYINDAWLRRLRFSLAHELGHFILHRRYIQKMDFKSADEYRAFFNGLPDTDYRRFEYQANEFAGRLLVPTAALQNEIKRVAGILKQNNLAGILRKDPKEVLYTVAPKLCAPFEVTEEVIRIRTEAEGLWPPPIVE